MSVSFGDATKVWNQFCEFTSIAGFRFMTTKITFYIRSTALIIFISSVVGLVAQLAYLLNQYFQSQVLISSHQESVSVVPLPLVYICNSLLDSGKVPFLDVCKRKRQQNQSVNSPERDEMTQELSNNISRKYFPYCNFEVSHRDYSCDFRCKWTSNGFCLEARRGFPTRFVSDPLLSLNATGASNSSARNASNFLRLQEARTFDIQIYFNDRNTYTTVYLRSYTDPLTLLNEYVPLVGAPHIVMDFEALNTIQITEILNITHGEPNYRPSNVSFEYCVWNEYSNMVSNEGLGQCDRQIYAKLSLHAMNESEFTSVQYGSSECSLQVAENAMNRCTEDKFFGRFEVETSRYISDKRMNKINLRVFVNDVISRNTLFTRKSHEFKLLSELGGSLSLYIGFTLMSVLEMVAFFCVPKVRQYAQIGEETLMQRKNPAIRNLPTLFRSAKSTFFRTFKRLKIHNTTPNIHVHIKQNA